MEQQISTAIKQKFGRSVSITPLHGGDINLAFKLEDNGSASVIKLNNSNSSKAMFEKEAAGLVLLKNNLSQLKVPEVLDVGSLSNGYEFIRIGFFERGNASPELLGEGLAELHSVLSSTAGLEYDNFIGTLVQDNRQCNSWSDFYLNQRIFPLLQKLSSYREMELIESCRSNLASLLALRESSLLHGDLWSGNVIEGNNSWALIDPAVYYGDPLVDIAMTRMFGGFSENFYSAYFNSVSCNFDNVEHKLEVYKWYPLLIHAVLFNGTYELTFRNSLQRILKLLS